MTENTNQVKLIWDLMAEQEKFVFATSLYKNSREVLDIIKQEDQELYSNILAFVFLDKKTNPTKEYDSRLNAIASELAMFEKELSKCNLSKQIIEKIIIKHYDYLMETYFETGEKK